MFKQDISFEVWGGVAGKYRLRDKNNNPIENNPQETCDRVSKTLANVETKDVEKYYKQFKSIMGTKFAGGGRIMANAGAREHKKETSPINCTVMRQIPDSLVGIMDVLKDAAITLKAGCGVGYDFSTIRPLGSYVFGAGAATSGVISFMKIFDAMCSTIMSGGSRRGAQMGCLDISHPEIESFIKSKRESGTLCYFNLSVLITDRFMEAVVNNDNWDLWFWEKCQTLENKKDVFVIKKNDIPYNHSEYEYFSFAKDHNEVLWDNCNENTVYVKKVYKTIPAKDLFDLIMKSTYEFREPGFILSDRVNKENNLYFCETIRCTNPCAEQPLNPLSACLLGSMILPAYVKNAFEDNVSFDFDSLYKDSMTASRALDNVVEINNLPLEEMREEILNKRRHGLGVTGLGSALAMMGIRYGSEESIKIAEKIAHIIAHASLIANINLAEEKGCAPIFKSKENRELVLKSNYLSRLIDSLENKKEIINKILKFGLRYSHATSMAPTGTLSLTWGNNCSSGIEPIFENDCLRNIIVAGKKTKVQFETLDYAFFLWKEKFGDKPLPKHWITTRDLVVDDHVKILSVLQKWCDSSISKTINVPHDCSFEQFKNIYIDGWKLGLKGLTTSRFDPAVSSGVLVQREDLEKTKYTFVLDNGEEVILRGSDTVEYDGDTHNVANLFDALNGGTYGNV